LPIKTSIITFKGIISKEKNENNNNNKSSSSKGGIISTSKIFSIDNKNEYSLK
jgi:hypothetical protein